ncbi:MAG TPA: CBS domain-containing protein [Candidatus Nanoarchaeia archaeon]|nr:CBS domain-containing protein [Candidatus Nanoarchaeia archaeon]
MVSIFEWLKKAKPFTNCYFELNALHVRDVMVKDVMTVGRYDSLVDAAHTMIGAHISCLVVFEKQKPVGIITERDFIKKLGMAKDHSTELLVNDLMTKELFAVDPHLSLFEAQKLMKAHKFRKLVVMEGDELRGIITQTDLCKAVANVKSSCPRAPIIADVMSRRVLIVGAEDSFIQAKKLMASKDIGSVLVMEKGEIIGMFTEFDIVSEFFLNPNRLRSSYMRELMTVPVICISPDFNMFEVNQLMLEHNFRRLPVIADNKLIGIVTQTDVAWHLYDFIEKNKNCGDERMKRRSEELKYVVKKAGNIILYQKVYENSKQELAGSEIQKSKISENKSFLDQKDKAFLVSESKTESFGKNRFSEKKGSEKK